MDFDHNLWGKIVPDGPAFCHWGGRGMSERIADMMKISRHDRILDLCCGQGGMADYLKGAGLVVGIDISREAILQAQRNSNNPRAIFVVGDATKPPFPESSFSKIVCQDADIWMYENKAGLLSEIDRLLKPGGQFFWQTYATNEKSTGSEMKTLLKKMGYSHHKLPYLEDIKTLMSSTGFSIKKFASLHKIYSHDNAQMLHSAHNLHKAFPKSLQIKNLIGLLGLEKKYFSKKIWTGALVVGQKIK